jgi:hypothetical protein
LVHLPLAFSIHHFVSSVGADAGFAAIVGLAILVLLYFAQARETSSLRDQSASASERVAELERRLALLGSAAGSPVAQPRAAEQPAAAQSLLGAPAGVGAPALAAATRVVPLPKLPKPTHPPVVPAPVAVSAAAAVAPAASVAPPPAGVTPGPATVAASSGGVPPLATPAPVPATPAPTGTNGTGEHPIARPAAPATVGGSQPRRVQLRPGSSFTPPPPIGPGGRHPASRRWLPAVGAVVLAIVAVAALLIVTSSGGSPQPAAGGKTTNAITSRPKPVFRPSSVTVAVLNGTDVFQLAHRVAVKLQHTGYKEGTIATATDQTHATTQVGYLSSHRYAATEVARALGLSAGAVAAADQSAHAVACPPPSACSADVIVTVGSDLSNTP